MTLPFLVLVSMACSPKSTAPTPEPAPAPAPAPEPMPEPAPEVTPASMYAECQGRVEGPQTDGECSSDDDCVRTGCSNEVCTNKGDAEGLTTTCEVLECFAVLDQCGCSEGTCTWTVKAAMPEAEGGG